MSIKKPALLIFYAFTLVMFQSAAVPAQKAAPGPRQEKLLNGLKVLVWNTPGSEKVSLKIRVHAGSSFDPQEKEGVMKLLSESLFPTAESRTFFTEELGGSLEVISNYDYIQINAEAKSSEFLPMLETVAQAITNPDLSKEATATLKTALLAAIQESERDPAYIADRAVAKRLFGTFPYGRPVLGTAASLQRVDFADLRFAKDRLLTADNATVAIRGNVDTSLALRAARRYFGAWLKSDKAIPSTFRQPDPPEAPPVKVEVPGLANSEVRYAFRGFARSAKDFAAAEILGRILQARLSDAVSKGSGSSPSVTHDEHVLPGAFVLRYKSQPQSPQMITAGGSSPASLPQTLLGPPVTDAEFAAAKNAVLAERAAADVMDLWLDVDTFRTAAVAEDLKLFQNVTTADVISLSAKLAREPVATAVVSAAATSSSNSSN